MNDNNLEAVKAEVLSGYDCGDRSRRIWFVNMHYSDGSQCIVDEKSSHSAALASAAEDGDPVEDNSAFR